MYLARGFTEDYALAQQQEVMHIPPGDPGSH